MPGSLAIGCPALCGRPPPVSVVPGDPAKPLRGGVRPGPQGDAGRPGTPGRDWGDVGGEGRGKGRCLAGKAHQNWSPEPPQATHPGPVIIFQGGGVASRGDGFSPQNRFLGIGNQDWPPSPVPVCPAPSEGCPSGCVPPDTQPPQHLTKL